MKELILTSIILILFASCTSESEFKFSTEDPSKLRIEVSRFIESLKSDNLNSSAPFRKDTVFWWNADFNGTFSGKPGIISSGISLNQVKGIDKLLIDSLHVSGDTLKGLVNVEKWYFPDGCTDASGERFCLDTNDIFLVIGKEKQITEILNVEYRRPGKIDCFYMDDSMISSNEYRQFVDEVALMNENEFQEYRDSVELHKNEFQLIVK